MERAQDVDVVDVFLVALAGVGGVGCRAYDGVYEVGVDAGVAYNAVAKALHKAPGRCAVEAVLGRVEVDGIGDVAHGDVARLQFNELYHAAPPFLTHTGQPMCLAKLRTKRSSSLPVQRTAILVDAWQSRKTTSVFAVSPAVCLIFG